jgi:hypothetical protein
VAQFDSENLQSALNSKDISGALKRLPEGLDAIYERALLKLKPREKAVVCLTWIAFARRPLSLARLAEAVGLSLLDDPPSLTDEELSESRIIEDLLPARLLPPGLVVVKEAKNSRKFVFFSHFSVKEYLVSDRIKSSQASEFALDEQVAHIQIAQACLRYHLYICKKKAQSKITEAMLRKYRFWLYAAKFGLGHVEAVARDQWPPSLYRRLEDVFEHRGVAFRNLVGLQGRLIFGTDPSSYRFPSPLYITSWLGHVQLLKFLLESSTAHIDSLGGYYGTALNLACARGDRSVMEILLDAGASPYVGNKEVRCALQPLVRRSAKSAIKKLLGLPGMLERCAELDYFPLVDAVRINGVHLMELLLRHGADVNACGKDGRSAYKIALEFGNRSAINFLRDHGAEVPT